MLYKFNNHEKINQEYIIYYYEKNKFKEKEVIKETKYKPLITSKIYYFIKKNLNIFLN